MRRVLPAVEHRKVTLARRQRHVAYLRKRRPDALRTRYLVDQSDIQDVWDGISFALQSALAAMSALDGEES